MTYISHSLRIQVFWTFVTDVLMFFEQYLTKMSPYYIGVKPHKSSARAVDGKEKEKASKNSLLITLPCKPPSLGF